MRRSVEVYRVRPITLGATVFASFLLQSYLPVKLPVARLFDLPLLVAIYFSLLRRNKVFGLALGTGMGLVQDALSHGYLGMYGMALGLVGYLASAFSSKFDFDQIIPRILLAGGLILVHSVFLAGLEQTLLESPPPVQPWDMASGILVNIAIGLILFQLLDQFRHPA